MLFNYYKTKEDAVKIAEQFDTCFAKVEFENGLWAVRLYSFDFDD